MCEKIRLLFFVFFFSICKKKLLICSGSLLVNKMIKKNQDMLLKDLIFRE